MKFPSFEFCDQQLLDITGAVPGEKFTFTCDAAEAGWGEAKFDLVHRGRSLPHTVREVEKGIYMITFTPQERGKHRVYVYYNGIEVKGTTLRSNPIQAITKRKESEEALPGCGNVNINSR